MDCLVNHPSFDQQINPKTLIYIDKLLYRKRPATEVHNTITQPSYASSLVTQILSIKKIASLTEFCF